MTYNERDAIYSSVEFIGKVRMAFADWIEYWAVSGTESIQDEDVREYTDSLIRNSLSNPEAYVKKLTTLVISEPNVKDAVEVTDANVSLAVTSILANAIKYLL